MVEPSQPGVRRCLKCGWLFVSPDENRIRRCGDCKKGDDDYNPRSAHVTQIESAAGSSFRD